VPIGARIIIIIIITKITQIGTTISVDGTGFSKHSVINLFNTQAGGGVVNLGGFGAGGKPNIPLTLVTRPALLSANRWARSRRRHSSRPSIRPSFRSPAAATTPARRSR
jgi:hypothetical protein